MRCNACGYVWMGGDPHPWRGGMPVDLPAPQDMYEKKLQEAVDNHHRELEHAVTQTEAQYFAHLNQAIETIAAVDSDQQATQERGVQKDRQETPTKHRQAALISMLRGQLRDRDNEIKEIKEHAAEQQQRASKQCVGVLHMQGIGRAAS